MKKKLSRLGLLLLLASLAPVIAQKSHAATITSGSAYTNDFGSQPPAIDWSTRTFGTAANGIGDAAAMDAAVQTNSAGLFTAQAGPVAADPPNNASTATWSSTGFYLQTRPTQNAVTLLMLTLTNSTGSDVNNVQFGYDYATNRAANVAEEVRGHRVYYSLSGATNSWIPLPSLSQTAQGTLSTNLTLAGTWTNARAFYLLWADDNGSGAPDDANDIDNFFFSATPAVASTTLAVPTNGASYPFHLPIPLAAAASPGPGATLAGIAFYDVTNGFLTNVLSAPYTNQLKLSAGTYRVYAISTNSLGGVSFSATNTVVAFVPPVDNTAPTIFSQAPLAGGTLSNLNSIQVMFTENVVGVDAGDLLVNDVPALSVTGSGSNYLFTISQPAYGNVFVRFVEGHDITDLAYPTFLGFYQNNPEASWSYTLVDMTAPTILARTPAANATVTNLTQINVRFSENVHGVDASGLLVNGVAAYAVAGSGSNYTFSVSQPAAETVNITWATAHGITDTAPAQNPFNGATGGWTFSLDAKTVLIQSNSFWLFVKGTSEASLPTNAWRQLGFDDSSWSNAPAPFFYGDPYSNGLPNFTLLSDMQGSYSSIFLRKTFTLPSVVTNLNLRIQIDDGLIAWINGVEVFRTNVFAGEPSYTNGTPAQGTEPNNQGAGYTTIALTNVASYATAGTNILAIQAFNQSLGGSSDFGFNAQLYTLLAGPETLAPTISAKAPAPGFIYSLTNITVTFSEPVTNVDAGDLLVNGVAASGVVNVSNSVFIFTVGQPAFGPIAITWAAGHSIVDQDTTPKPFDANGAGATWSYMLLNSNAPVIAAQSPAAGLSVTGLTQIAVTFSKTVTGVDAADLLINGTAATSVSGSGSNYTFQLIQPAYGSVGISWIANHGIQDTAGNLFAPVAPGNTWNYTLIDQIAPFITAQTPLAGSFVSSVTQVTVTFSEAVSGVDAGDLLINGKRATNVTGSGAAYTFTFPPPNSTTAAISWAPNHGIVDSATTPNPFDASRPGASWTYSTVDAVAPNAAISPSPELTVRSLTSIRVTFDEPVHGVDAADLLINNNPAASVSGSGAGPYIFTFTAPPAGTVSVQWAANNGIADQAASPNAFAGGAWTYTIDPNLLTDVALGYIVQISLDGLGAVYLSYYMTNAPDQFPNFVRLAREGAFTLNARCDYDASITIPNHASMFTGRPVLQPNGLPNTTHHGYTSDAPGSTDTLHNSGNLNVPYKAAMFDVAHDYGRTTAFYAGKARLQICDRSYDAANGAPDTIGVDNGRDKIDFASVNDVSGTSISNEVNTLIADLTSASPRQYTFLHIAEPDLTGHSSSWGSANWSNAVHNVDVQLGRVLDAVDAHPLMSNRTAVIVTADHGGGGGTPNNHTEAFHINNYTIPFFLRSPGIPGGLDLYQFFANRGNPGTNRTDYTTDPQPIRNADGSNLALSLLGLPPIPGSLIVPVLKTTTGSLRIARYGALTTVFWYDPNGDSVLEMASAVGAPNSWHTVTNGVTLNETTKSFSITNSAGTSFFRVRKL